MQNFMKTILNAVQKWTKSEIKTLQNNIADNLDNKKMDKDNPIGTGSFSMNRMPNSLIGEYSHAEGNETQASGDVSHAEGNETQASGDVSHAEGSFTKAFGPGSHAEGGTTQASGEFSHAEGYFTMASGEYSHAEGNETQASGYVSHAEGIATRASGEASHAEGGGTTASGLDSHAEGGTTQASGAYSHAEGGSTTASGACSHAEGGSTTASGNQSHAEGFFTIANSESQHVQGVYNIVDNNGDTYTKGTYAHIVGNGTSSSKRSNAHTLDWDGNAWFAGDVYVGSTSGTNKDEGSVKLATEEYVNSVKDCIQIKDTENNYDYIITMKNGNLVSFCKCDHIEITQMPTRIEYTQGEPFDPSGLVVTAIYQDGTTKIVDNYTYPEIVTSIEGIEIQYNEFGTNYTINIPLTVNEFNPAVELIDFDYTTNSDGTYTITAWKETLNGEPSTEMIVPNNGLIIV